MTSVLGVMQVAHPGGAEVGFLRLGRRLRDRGWDVALTTPEPGPLSDAGFPAETLDCGGLASGAGARAVASWPRARRLTKDVDVVYLNGTVAGRLLPALRGRRTVLHVHDMVTRVPRHWHQADVVLADSQAVADRLSGLDAHVVHCPVELDVAPAPAPWQGAGDGRPVVGFVGRIEPRKGPLDLVRAAPAIRAARPDARVVLVGADPYGSDPDYAQQVAGSHEVEHVGWVPDAAGVMGHLDVLVAPSREEPFGTVLSEAMAAGVPVVASDVDGLPEVVTDGVDGFLVPVGDVDALARRTVEALARRDELGAAAREAARRFDADRYAERVAELIAP
ncbi:glycosyltransferase family 4 protein [Conexibacter sp. SYSU D00693]|uniref:glycosyltransferase family 4 protein n=1 Tax=Conexibacter sp. SYSU D00693 TaxID=2812560 RepID=UPI00196B77E9|nr:glycosyltransferase family 4 protein [Conexibacter sp. SYSU D00693]